jgi:hypothetical protein
MKWPRRGSPSTPGRSEKTLPLEVSTGDRCESGSDSRPRPGDVIALLP